MAIITEQKFTSWKKLKIYIYQTGPAVECFTILVGLDLEVILLLAGFSCNAKGLWPSSKSSTTMMSELTLLIFVEELCRKALLYRMMLVMATSSSTPDSWYLSAAFGSGMWNAITSSEQADVFAKSFCGLFCGLWFQSTLPDSLRHVPLMEAELSSNDFFLYRLLGALFDNRNSDFRNFSELCFLLFLWISFVEDL